MDSGFAVEIKITYFLEASTQQKIFFLGKINHFQGDLTDRSCETKTLIVECVLPVSLLMEIWLLSRDTCKRCQWPTI